MYYRHEGLKINNGWVHPVSNIKYTKANWFDCIKNDSDLLNDYGVTRHDGPIKPAFDSSIQYLKLDQAGEYEIVDYTEEELNNMQLESDILKLQSAGKDTVLVLVELIQWMLNDPLITIEPQDFTPNVRQAYQELKSIADRVK